MQHKQNTMHRAMKLLFFISSTFLLSSTFSREICGDSKRTLRALNAITPVSTSALSPTAASARVLPSDAVGTVVALRLVNANSDSNGQEIIGSMKNNTIIDLASFPSNQLFNVEAVTYGIVGIVRFDFDTKSPFNIESSAPFAMCQNEGRRYKSCNGFNIGFHTIRVTPWSEKGSTGIRGASYVVSFQVINTIRRPTSSPVRLPTKIPETATTLTSGIWIETNHNASEIIRRHEACFLMVGRKAYLLGGRYRSNNAVDIYDPVSRSWSKGKAPPAEIHHAQCINVNGKIWIPSSWYGKYPMEKNHEFIFIYDPTTDSWSTKPGLPESRRRGAAAAILVGRKIFVSHGNIGGHERGNHSTTLGWLDYYDIDDERWHTNLPNAPNPRDHAGGALVNGRICVAGGRDGGDINFYNKPILPTDCYDPVSNSWSVEANIPYTGAGAAYGTTCDGKLIVAGGESSSASARSNVVVFDGKQWLSLDSLSVARHGTGLAIDCVCNQIYIASGAGSRGGRNEISSVETYFPKGVDESCFQ